MDANLISTFKVMFLRLSVVIGVNVISLSDVENIISILLLVLMSIKTIKEILNNKKKKDDK